jgi:hypothetical protein
MKLRDCSLSDLGELDCGYACGELPSGAHLKVLAVRLAGAADRSSNPIFELASAVIMAGLEAWRPWALILDLRGLEYSWGDQMENVLQTAERWYEPLQPTLAAFGGESTPREFPVAVVVSDLNRDGFESLVREQMGREPRDLLFETLEDAIAALDARLVGFGGV